MDRYDTQIKEIKFGIVVLLIGIVVATYWLYNDARVQKNNIAFVEESMGRYIEYMIDEGNLTLGAKSKIIQELSEKFDNVNVEGTPAKVGTGGEVNLMIQVYNTNSAGGTTFSKTFTGEGIAK